MKKKYYFVFILVTFFAIKVYADSKTIILDSEGTEITAAFNEQGIIEEIDGTIGTYTCTPMEIQVLEDIVNIKLKYSGDGCFNINLKIWDPYIEVTKIFTENKVFKKRENLTYKIIYNKNDNYILRDNFVCIDKLSMESIVTDASDSFLPLIKYSSNICIQFFGNNIQDNSIGSRKYLYSSDKKNIECFQIMPGDIWEKYLSTKIFDFKSNKKVVNLINYLILYNYNDQIGAMVFPYLFDFDDSN